MFACVSSHSKHGFRFVSCVLPQEGVPLLVLGFALRVAGNHHNPWASPKNSTGSLSMGATIETSK